MDDNAAVVLNPTGELLDGTTIQGEDVVVIKNMKNK